MIIKTFDNGWGPELELKQFEAKILKSYLRPITACTQRWIVINSTWYTQDYHQEVLTQLRSLDFDGIVLVAFIDAAIPMVEWYSECAFPVLPVGYYQGEHQIDFWALMAHRYMDLAPYGNLQDSAKIDTAYMCLNRKPHGHRRQLYQQLDALGLVDQGIVSMGGDDEYPVQKLLDIDQGSTNIAPNANAEHHGMPNDIASLGHPANWQRHLVNVVTETTWDISQNQFVSEKIFKPLLGQRPFLVYDPDGASSWLSARGFELYHSDFQDISDQDPALPNNVARFLQQLCWQDTSYFQSKFIALQEKIMYNHNNFHKYVVEQIKKISQVIL